MACLVQILQNSKVLMKLQWKLQTQNKVTISPLHKPKHIWVPNNYLTHEFQTPLIVQVFRIYVKNVGFENNYKKDGKENQLVGFACTNPDCTGTLQSLINNLLL
jgi:hypothetical protein